MQTHTHTRAYARALTDRKHTDIVGLTWLVFLYFIKRVIKYERTINTHTFSDS